MREISAGDTYIVTVDIDLWLVFAIFLRDVFRKEGALCSGCRVGTVAPRLHLAVKEGGSRAIPWLGRVYAVMGGCTSVGCMWVVMWAASVRVGVCVVIQRVGMPSGRAQACEG